MSLLYRGLILYAATLLAMQECFECDTCALGEIHVHFTLEKCSARMSGSHALVSCDPAAHRHLLKKQLISKALSSERAWRYGGVGPSRAGR